MGSLLSRRNDQNQVVEIRTNNAYRYPPKSGSYFGSHFIMGGERFDMPEPESYLFGENEDLNYMGTRPVPFPYPPPQGTEPTKTLKSLVNIRKSSVKFVRVTEAQKPGLDGESKAEVVRPHNKQSSVNHPHREKKTSETETNKPDSGSTPDKTKQPKTCEEDNGSGEPQEPKPEEDVEPENTEPEPCKYNVEFTFDSDSKCAITIYYFATEEIVNGQIVYHPRDGQMNSETFHYKAGVNQTFCQSTHIIDPRAYPDTDWQYNTESETTPVIPIVIQCVVEEDESAGHAHMLFCTVDKHAEMGFVIKPLKQKQYVDGLCYLLQEIYGVENKVNERVKDVDDDEVEDTGSECIICMSEPRDTLILPCRHLCLCSQCAESLRYQSSFCPICRASFRALLQIRAMRKKPQAPVTTHQQQVPPAEDAENAVSQEGVPAGFEAISLIEALNGPYTAICPPANTQMTPTDGVPGVKTADTDRKEKKRSVKKKQSENLSTPGDCVAIAMSDEAVKQSKDESKQVKSGDNDEALKSDTDANRGATPEVVMSGDATEPIKAHKDEKTNSPTHDVKEETTDDGSNKDETTLPEEDCEAAPPEESVLDVTVAFKQKKHSTKHVSKEPTATLQQLPEGMTSILMEPEYTDALLEMATGHEADDEHESSDEDSSNVPSPEYNKLTMAYSGSAKHATHHQRKDHRSRSKDKEHKKEEIELLVTSENLAVNKAAARLDILEAHDPKHEEIELVGMSEKGSSTRPRDREHHVDIPVQENAWTVSDEEGTSEKHASNEKLGGEEDNSD